MKITYFLTLFVSFLFLCCSTSPEKTEGLSGMWESVGYGKVIKIDSNRYVHYDVTTLSCLPSSAGKLSDFQEIIQMEDTLYILNGFNGYRYHRIASIPDLCGYEISETQRLDPMYNFKVLAENYREHFAFLDLNQIKWDELYQSTMAKIKPSMSQAELFVILEDMIDVLNDQHGYLEGPDEIMEAADKIRRELRREDVPGEAKVYGDFEIAGMVVRNHLIEELTRESKIVNWGFIEKHIGYIQVKAMMLHAQLTLDSNMMKATGWVSTYFDELNKLPYYKQIQAEEDGINDVMDLVMSDLREVDTMIIDVRFNGGGHDQVGMEIIKYFNPDNRVHFATKKARTGENHTVPIRIYLDATESPYMKPTFLLTSQQSGSATEIMAMSTMQLQHIKRVGTSTMGATSDALQKRLPNGWEFGVSNEVYSDPDGKCYENIGIPVDIEMNYPGDRQSFFRMVANDLDGDKSSILKAIRKE